MGSDSDSFCLKWNDFPGSISSTLGSLRAASSPLQVTSRKQFGFSTRYLLECIIVRLTSQDVTLQCGTESLKAHRLVLALCRYKALHGTLDNAQCRI